MNPADDYSALSTCTTCEFTEDTSNYWTATLYFRARNGTFKRVPTMAGHSVEEANRGTTVYYIPPANNKTKATAFKKVKIVSSTNFSSIASRKGLMRSRAFVCVLVNLASGKRSTILTSYMLLSVALTYQTLVKAVVSMHQEWALTRSNFRPSPVLAVSVRI